ncbi:MAG TPA: hypothetical protein VN906_08385 [Candidatus Sulfotelmatobacter sp.]|nr:hypothetical protein [Candidatus Sulfotelmatobacter sp.]
MPVANPTPAFSDAPAAPATRAGHIPMATIGGIAAIIGVVIVFVGCALPYVHYSGDTGGQTADPSVFNGGFPGAWGNAVEPVVVVLLALAASIVVIAWPNRTARAFSSGALVAMGVTTLGMFIAYIAAGSPFGHLEAGAFVGPIGAVVLLVGGLLAAGSLLMPQESRPIGL